MPSLHVTAQFQLSPGLVYHYVRALGDPGNATRDAFAETVGPMPESKLLEDAENERLRYEGPVGLEQTYEFEALSGNRTQLTATYRWSWWTALSGFGRAGHAARVGAVSTVASVEALEREDVRSALLNDEHQGAP